MKKLFVLLLVMVFAISFAAAEGQIIKISEDQDAFDLFITLPENASIVSTEVEDEYSITDIVIEGNDMLDVKIVTSPDELYAGVSLSDLSDEDVNGIVGWFIEELIQPNIVKNVSGNNIEYIVINEDNEGNDSCETITLVRGYEIMISVSRTDFSDLSADEMAIGAAIMETLQIMDK